MKIIYHNYLLLESIPAFIIINKCWTISKVSKNFFEDFTLYIFFSDKIELKD